MLTPLTRSVLIGNYQAATGCFGSPIFTDKIEMMDAIND
jgi:hypothetical protein